MTMRMTLFIGLFLSLSFGLYPEDGMKSIAPGAGGDGGIRGYREFCRGGIQVSGEGERPRRGGGCSNFRGGGNFRGVWRRER